MSCEWARAAAVSWVLIETGGDAAITANWAVSSQIDVEKRVGVPDLRVIGADIARGLGDGIGSRPIDELHVELLFVGRLADRIKG
jgi:hypothetical protein